jgi:RNA polymerase sigma factor (sigma-70 family)
MIKKTGLRKDETIDLATLDRLLDVPIPAWDRSVRRLVKVMRARAVRIAIPDRRGAAVPTSSHVTWVGLFEAQVKSLPRMDRAEEILMARRYEFCKARVTDALLHAGYPSPLHESLVMVPFDDLPEPRRRRSAAAQTHLEACSAELQRLRNLYVEGALYLVLAPVRRYRNLGVDEADLVQEGNASLFQAIEGFDWRRDVRFKTYAVYWIQQAILKTLYNCARTVRIPVWVQKAYRKMQRFRDEVRHLTGIEPTDVRVGEHLGLPEDRVRDILGVRRYAVSLDAAVSDDGFTLGHTLADDDAVAIPDAIRDVDLGARLRAAMADLPDRQRQIVIRRFGLDGREPETLAEIAGDFGVTAERVRQLQKAALTRLQSPQRLRRLAPLA